MRSMIRGLLGLVLRLFFRRVEVSGLERLPQQGGLLFVLNHPNALVDPLVLLCLVPRPVSFLAKAPLFKMPFIGWLCRALDCLPVYRHQDKADTSQNRDTFQRAHQILNRNGAIAIFPEGTTHSDPRLRPLKSGAARIALGAVSVGGGCKLHLVPAGLYYTDKQIFRSKALLYFGEPIVVDPVSCGPDGEPDHHAVQQLSEKIRAALEEVTLNAEHHEALQLIARAERIFTVGEADRSLARQFERRRLFLEGYSYHLQHSPQRLQRLAARIRRYEADLEQAGVAPENIQPQAFSASRVLRYTVRSLLLFAMLLLPAVVGTIIHWPAYRLIGVIAGRMTRRDVTATSTVKMCGALLLFPLSWGVASYLAYGSAGVAGAVATWLLAPLTGYAALRFMEHLDRIQAASRALVIYLLRRDSFQRLTLERDAIQVEIAGLGEEWQAAAKEPGPR